MNTWADNRDYSKNTNNQAKTKMKSWTKKG